MMNAIEQLDQEYQAKRAQLLKIQQDAESAARDLASLDENKAAIARRAAQRAAALDKLQTDLGRAASGLIGVTDALTAMNSLVETSQAAMNEAKAAQQAAWAQAERLIVEITWAHTANRDAFDSDGQMEDAARSGAYAALSGVMFRPDGLDTGDLRSLGFIRHEINTQVRQLVYRAVRESLVVRKVAQVAVSPALDSQLVPVAA